jgi:hypothetical protein
MIATRVKDRDNHEIGIGEQPLLSFGAGSFGSAGNRAQMFVPGESTKMVQAYARESRYFVFGEDLLTRFYAYHVRVLSCFDA